MKYEITYICGHKAIKDIYGSQKDRERKAEILKDKYLCPKCYQKALEEKPENTKKIRIKYAEYKRKYQDYQVVKNSYNKKEKTIKIYIPK